MEQTTSRLRKTFRYPTEDDSEDDLPEVLDEEEQDKLIQTLAEESEVRNKQYTQILLFLPLASIIPYVPTLLAPSTALLSLLCMTSLLSTAYLLYILPPGVTSIPFLDTLNSQPQPSKQQRRKVLSQLGIDDGPLRTYLPYLNLGLCGVLAVLGSVVGGRRDIWWGFGWLPALVQATILLAKFWMGSVDPERELGELRYGLKGA